MKKYRVMKDNIVELFIEKQQSDPDEITVAEISRLLIYSAGIVKDHELAVVCLGMLSHQRGNERVLAIKAVREAIKKMDRVKLAAYILKHL